MRTHPRYPDLALIDAAAVSRGEIPERFGRHREALHSVVDWSWSYLTQAHPELGRRGAVCPYARASLLAGTYYLAVCPGRPDDPDQVADLLERYCQWFVELEPTSGRDSQLKTVLVLFPDLPRPEWPRLIDASQRLLKTQYVKHGFMIGEFHDGPPDKGGLRNERFRPLRSPVPMLVMRHMVATDLPFLDQERPHFQAYLERFGWLVPAGERQRFAAAVHRFEFGLTPSETFESDNEPAGNER